jgi:hypothetical protein
MYINKGLNYETNIYIYIALKFKVIAPETGPEGDFRDCRTDSNIWCERNVRFFRSGSDIVSERHFSDFRTDFDIGPERDFYAFWIDSIIRPERDFSDSQNDFDIRAKLDFRQRRNGSERKSEKFYPEIKYVRALMLNQRKTNENIISLHRILLITHNSLNSFELNSF